MIFRDIRKYSTMTNIEILNLEFGKFLKRKNVGHGFSIITIFYKSRKIKFKVNIRHPNTGYINFIIIKKNKKATDWLVLDHLDKPYYYSNNKDYIKLIHTKNKFLKEVINYFKIINND